MIAREIPIPYGKGWQRLTLRESGYGVDDTRST